MLYDRIIDQAVLWQTLTLVAFFLTFCRQQRLLIFDGVVPIYHKKEKYNLPLVVWLPEGFPVAPPIAYVKRDDPEQFVFNPNCSIIDRANNGCIHSDYLRNWTFQLSNIRDFVCDLQIYFAEKPPLFAKRRTSDGPATASTPASSSSEAGLLHAVNPLAAGIDNLSSPPRPPPASDLWAGVLAPRPSPPPPQVVPPPPPPVAMATQSSVFNPAPAQQSPAVPAPLLWNGEVGNPDQQRRQTVKQQTDASYRLALSTALSARLASALEASASVELEQQLNIQGELRTRAAKLASELQKAQKEREALDTAAHELTAVGMALDQWLADNEHRAQSLRPGGSGDTAAGGFRVDPDEAIVAADSLSAEALTAQATDFALEDAMSALDRALEARVFHLTDYLYRVRMIARMQFTARALLNKIAARQSLEKQSAQKLRASGGSGPVLKVATSAEGEAADVARRASTGAMGVGVGTTQMPIGDLASESTSGVLMNPLATAAKGLRLK